MSLEEYNGTDLCNLSVVRDSTGKHRTDRMKGTARFVSIQTAQLPTLIEALQEAARKAIEIGVLASPTNLADRQNVVLYYLKLNHGDQLMAIHTFNKRLDKLEATREKGLSRVISFINDPRREGFETVEDALTDAGIVSRPDDFHIVRRIVDPRSIARNGEAKQNRYRVTSVSDPYQRKAA